MKQFKKNLKKCESIWPTLKHFLGKATNWCEKCSHLERISLVNVKDLYYYMAKNFWELFLRDPTREIPSGQDIRAWLAHSSGQSEHMIRYTCPLADDTRNSRCNDTTATRTSLRSEFAFFQSLLIFFNKEFYGYLVDFKRRQKNWKTQSHR